MQNKTIIHKSLVGSRAHGLQNEDSDYDYRAIYVISTQEILSLNHKYSGSSWVEGEEDNTAYEIGHFLHLATKANPSVLEVITKDCNAETSKYSQELIGLLPYMYSPKDAFNAFTGYSLNQRKKFLDDNSIRKNKFAVAYIRTLYNLNHLLEFGFFNLEVDEVVKPALLQIRNGNFTEGDIINHARMLTLSAETKLQKAKDYKDLSQVNEFLLKIRKDFWI